MSNVLKKLFDPLVPTEAEEQETKDRFVRAMMHLGRKSKLNLLEAAFPFVDWPEKKRRIELIDALLAEYRRIDTKGERFCINHIYMGVESVIDGDWKRCAEIAEWLEYTSESKQIREKYGPEYATVRAVLRRAAVSGAN